MAARPQGYVETGDGLWFPHKARYPMGRLGCSILVALAGLVPSICLIIGGEVLTGASFLAGAALLILLLGMLVEPYGMALTESCVRLERRSLYRQDRLEIPKSAWIELWNYEESEEEARVYLYTRLPDRPRSAYAVLIFWGAPDAVKETARRVAEVLDLRRRRAFIPAAFKSPLVPVSESDAMGQAKMEHQDLTALVKDDSDGPTAKANLGRALKAEKMLNEFDCLQNPESWLLEPKRATLTHQTVKARTEHSFDQVAAVEIEAEKEAEAGGADDPNYSYLYAVNLVLTSGERFLLQRYSSGEMKKTPKSAARREAEEIASELRTTFGLPERE
jgi:hypothetical protein